MPSNRASRDRRKRPVIYLRLLRSRAPAPPPHYNSQALIGFQGRGLDDVVQPDFRHGRFLRALIFQSGDSSELAPRLPCKGKSVRNRGVSQTMPFLVIPRSLLRGGFICLWKAINPPKSLCQNLSQQRSGGTLIVARLVAHSNNTLK